MFFATRRLEFGRLISYQAYSILNACTGQSSRACAGKYIPANAAAAATRDRTTDNYTGIELVIYRVRFHKSVRDQRDSGCQWANSNAV